MRLSLLSVGLLFADTVSDMLNGAGMLHGGCLAYIVDKWVSFFFFKAVFSP